jgi:hypothetical protein
LRPSPDKGAKFYFKNKLRDKIRRVGEIKW